MTPKQKLIAQAQALKLKTDGLTVVQLKQLIADHEAKQAEATPDSPKPQEFAKSGKRSQKAVLEKQALIDKAKLKQDLETKTVKPPKVIPKTRPLLERRSKKYRQAHKTLDKHKAYEIEEGIKQILKTSTTKFDSSVEVVIGLNLDVKQAEQNLRNFVVLPEGQGKKVVVAAFVEDDQIKASLEAGADIAGHEVFLQQLDKNQLNFDVLISTPQLMIKLAKYAKLLGPRGLMPNPKSGTVTKNIAQAITDAKSGKVEYRVDEGGNLHLNLGKVSFGVTKIKHNFEVLFKSVLDNKPATVKGVYVKDIYLSTTMGPSLKLAKPVLK